VVSTSKIATGSMVSSSEVQYPDGDWLRQKIAERTQSDQNTYLDANALAEGLFGSHMPANVIVIGAAYQAGLLPISAGAIEQAITLNGAAIETNLQAFQAGRLTVADPEWVMSLDLRRTGELLPAPEVSPQAQRLLDQVNAQGELKRLLAIRIPELIAYQDEQYAQAYATFVRHVSETERRKIGAHSRLSEAVARSLFKLMAYKDEYEVARLHLKPEMTRALARQFGEHARIRFQLHPPFMRRLGMQKKIGLGRWFVPVLHLLAWMKWTRGTPLDIFGHTPMRRTERMLIGEYRSVIENALNQLEPGTYARVIKLAALPDMIRGYEEIKRANIAHYRAKVQECLNDLATQSANLEKMDEG
jgi:indolepyruvate ferredoxin oxidoreductase